ncbi:toll/interleukin-1 receptor domain-containing protein [Mycolicibacterium novocastrense]|uniref:toll/interleukin-1 receptor domain-containing protein n=1 Tax=Mycolicibacterium novocastrense TaxID=59813 RepID=UPI0009E7ADA0|nr:toll/interleukin-1 receptor domain-containing protein [Mycolicibacterium novocastrense]
MSAKGGHVFISYVRDDKSAVDALCAALEGEGIPVWRDIKSLWPGENWKREIAQAIASSSLVFVPVFSKASAAREKSYQNEEINLAIEEFRKMPLNKTWIIPVRLSEVAVPAFQLRAGEQMGDLTRCDLFGRRRAESLQRLITQLKTLVKTSLGSP